MQATRGTSVSFEAKFVDMDGDPLTPGDPTSTPKVQVFDPQCEEVATAVGAHIGKGIYRWSWFVPTDAMINTVDERWMVKWFFITQGGYTSEYEEAFDVIDAVESTPEERKQMLIGRPNRSERIFLRLEDNPEQLELEVLNTSNQVIVHVDEYTTDQNLLKPTDLDRKIGTLVRDGQYIFYYDLPSLDIGEYLIFWGIRETEVSQMEFEHQTLRIPPYNFWRLSKPLEMVIDKLQKRTKWVQAYTDADLLEFIVRGLGTVNMVRPNTEWQLRSLPAGMEMATHITDAVLLAATVHALMAQQILEIELGFNFSGQTVTLDYNHDYGGVIGNIRDMWNIFVEAKPRLYRVACGPGVAGVRPYNYRLNNRVYRIPNNEAGASGYDASGLVARVFGS